MVVCDFKYYKNRSVNCSFKKRWRKESFLITLSYYSTGKRENFSYVHTYAKKVIDSKPERIA